MHRDPPPPTFIPRFNLEAGRTAIDPSELTTRMNPAEIAALSKKLTEVSRFRQGLVDALLFAAARAGTHNVIPPLLSGIGGALAQLNCADDFGRSPLFWAVLRRRFRAARTLLMHGANVDQGDGNQVTALILAAHMGDLPLVRLLLVHGASLSARDCLGLTPLHHAAARGHVRIAVFLAQKLELRAHGPSAVDFLTPIDDEAMLEDDFESSTDSIFALKRWFPVFRRSERRATASSARPKVPESAPMPSGRLRGLRLLRNLVRKIIIANAWITPISSAASNFLEGEGDTEVEALSQRQAVTFAADQRASQSSATGDSAPPTLSARHMRIAPRDISGSGYSLDPLSLGGFQPVSKSTRKVAVDDVWGWSADSALDTAAARVARRLALARSEESARRSSPRPCSTLCALLDERLGARDPSTSLRVATLPRVSPLTLAVHAQHRSVCAALVRFGADATAGNATVLSPYDRSLLLHGQAARNCFRFDGTVIAGSPAGDAASVSAGIVPVAAPPVASQSAPLETTDSAVTTDAIAHPAPLLATEKRPSKWGVLKARLLQKAGRAKMDTSPDGGSAPREGGTAELAASSPKLRIGGKREASIVAETAPSESSMHSSSVPSVPLRKKTSRMKLVPALTLQTGALPVDNALPEPPQSTQGKREAAPPHDDGERPANGSELADKRVQAERDRLSAAAEREREAALLAAQRAERHAAALVHVLNGSQTVQASRWRFAVRTLAREVLAFLLLVAGCALFTVMAPDYDAVATASMASSLRGDLVATLVETVHDRSSWLAFIDANLLSSATESCEDPNGSISRDSANISAADRHDALEPSIIFRSGGPQLARFVRENRYLKPGGIRGALSRLFDARPGETDLSLPPPATAASPTNSGAANGLSCSEAPSPLTLLGAFLVVGSVHVERETAHPERVGTGYGRTGGRAFGGALQQYVSFSLRADALGMDAGSLSWGDSTDLDSALSSVRSARILARHAGENAQIPHEAHCNGSQLVPWTDDSTTALALDLTVYAPALEVLAAVRARTAFPARGGADSSVEVRTLKLNGRFQPSLLFEAALTLQLGLTAIQLRDGARRAGGWLTWVRAGWNQYELLVVALFATILLADVANRATVRAIGIDLAASGVYVPLWDLAGWVRAEVDLVSVLFYLLVIRAVRYARLIPGWGPILMAVISTIQVRSLGRCSVLLVHLRHTPRASRTLL